MSCDEDEIHGTVIQFVWPEVRVLEDRVPVRGSQPNVGDESLVDLTLDFMYGILIFRILKQTTHSPEATMSDIRTWALGEGPHEHVNFFLPHVVAAPPGHHERAD